MCAHIIDLNFLYNLFGCFRLMPFCVCRCVRSKPMHSNVASDRDGSAIKYIFRVFMPCFSLIAVHIIYLHGIFVSRCLTLHVPLSICLSFFGCDFLLFLRFEYVTFLVIHIYTKFLHLPPPFWLSRSLRRILLIVLLLLLLLFITKLRSKYWNRQKRAKRKRAMTKDTMINK